MRDHTPGVVRLDRLILGRNDWLIFGLRLVSTSDVPEPPMCALVWMDPLSVLPRNGRPHFDIDQPRLQSHFGAGR